MLGILSVGLLIGMQHALEADHVAAVSCIATRERSVGRIVRHGVIWGFGHCLTLIVIAGGAILFGAVLPDRFSTLLEVLVGGMLVILGGQVIYRLVRDRLHFHRHRHSDGTVHLHAHSHAKDALPVQDTHPQQVPAPKHDHGHPAGLPWRTLLIGMTHGMAGSAALLVVTAAGMQSSVLSFAYIALFGVGSLVGMALLSSLMAVPLAWSARAMTWTHRGLQSVTGTATAALGLWIAVEAVSKL